MAREEIRSALKVLLASKREEIFRRVSARGARNVRIFGSIARGEDCPESDIDLLVEKGPEFSLLDHAALICDLSDLLGRRVDVATENGLRPSIRERVLLEAIPL